MRTAAIANVSLTVQGRCFAKISVLSSALQERKCYNAYNIISHVYVMITKITKIRLLSVQPIPANEMVLEQQLYGRYVRRMINGDIITTSASHRHCRGFVALFTVLIHLHHVIIYFNLYNFSYVM